MALGELGDARTVLPLVKYLSNQRVDRREKELARAAVARIGTAAIPGLWDELLRNSSDRVLKEIHLLLNQASWEPANIRERVWYALTALWSSGSEQIAVGELGESAIDPLIDIFTSGPRDTWVWIRAVEALAHIGGDRALDPIVKAFHEDNQRTCVLKALKTLDWHPDNTEDQVRWLIANGRWTEAMELGDDGLRVVREAQWRLSASDGHEVRRLLRINEQCPLDLTGLLRIANLEDHEVKE